MDSYPSDRDTSVIHKILRGRGAGPLPSQKGSHDHDNLGADFRSKIMPSPRRGRSVSHDYGRQVTNGNLAISFRGDQFAPRQPTFAGLKWLLVVPFWLCPDSAGWRTAIDLRLDSAVPAGPC